MKERRQQGILTGMPFMANLASRTFVDDLTRKIYLANPPSRIVSLAPGATEILYAIGAGELVAGVSEDSDYPPDARAKPAVGVLSPSLDSITGLRPDLVLCPLEGTGRELVRALDRLKVPAYALDVRTVGQVFFQIQTIGRMVGRSGPADVLAAALRDRVNGIQRQTAHQTRPRVLCLASVDPPIAVGPDSLAHHLLEWAGATNVAASGQGPEVPIGLDDVCRQDPEVIVVAFRGHGPEQIGGRQFQGKWGDLAAVRQGRVLRIPRELLMRPGPRVAEGLETLAKLLHPNLPNLPNLDPPNPDVPVGES